MVGVSRGKDPRGAVLAGLFACWLPMAAVAATTNGIGLGSVVLAVDGDEAEGGGGEEIARSPLRVHVDGIPFLSAELRDRHLGELQGAAYANGVVDVEKFKAFVGAHPDRDVLYYWNGPSYPPATLARLLCLHVSGDLSADEHGEFLDWATRFNEPAAPPNGGFRAGEPPRGPPDGQP